MIVSHCNIKAVKRFIIAILSFLALGGGITILHAQANQVVLKLDDETKKILTNSLQDTWFKKETFTSTVLGGLLAIAGGFAATLYAYKLESNYKRQQEADFCKNLLRAIRCEVEALHQTYDTGIGKILNETKDGHPFLWRLGLTEDWFTVYSSNAANIGRLEGKVALQIITVYVLIKKLIEQYRINNVYLNELEASEREPQIVGRANRIKQNMISHLVRIKEADRELKDAKRKLTEMFDERGVKYSV